MKIRLISLFILLSFITQGLAPMGTHAILSRLTPSDLFAFVAIIISFREIFRGFMQFNRYNRIYIRGIIMVMSFLVPMIVSLNAQSTLLESLIVMFLIFTSILISYHFRDKFQDALIPLIIYTVFAAIAFGIYDYAAGMTGLPRVFPDRAPGEILSGFRNAGQAGAYFLVMISILFPIRYSSLFKTFDLRKKALLNTSIILSVIFLLLTGKIAAYIGMLIGFLLFAIFRRKASTAFSLIFFALLLTIVYLNLATIAPDVYWRINMKYETRIASRLEGEHEGDFMADNFGAAIKAFEDRPLVGTGLGAFSGTYSYYEVHSTYFKLLGETGVLGIIGYLIFIIGFFRLFKVIKFRKFNPYADYLFVMLPFVIGCMVSWGYTYHLRKREFWILVSVILIVVYQTYLYNAQLRRKSNEAKNL